MTWLQGKKTALHSTQPLDTYMDNVSADIFPELLQAESLDDWLAILSSAKHLAPSKKWVV